MEIRPVEPHEASRLRNIRLVALQDAPHAFGSTYEREADRPLEAWAGASCHQSPITECPQRRVCGMVLNHVADLLRTLTSVPD